MGLRNLLDKVKRHFEKGGHHGKWYPLYEAMDTFFYHPGSVTRTTAHVHDGIDLKCMMIIVWLCIFPTMFSGAYSTDHWANLIFAWSPDLLSVQGGWHFALIDTLVGFGPSSLWDRPVQGVMYPLLVYLTTFIVGGFQEVLSASIRRHEVNEGFFITSTLFALTLSPSVPLWQVALEISFGMVLSKEVLGGTGKNFLNLTLVGRVFLFSIYPVRMPGDAVQALAGGFTGATSLSLAAADGVGSILDHGLTWTDVFLGHVQGSMGEISTLAILIDDAVLLLTRTVSWRIVAGMMLGTVAMSCLFNTIGSADNPMFAVFWCQHLVTGSFTFGMILMAIDPVSVSMTDTGRQLFSAPIGVMVMLVRVVNPASPEDMVLAVLLANLSAPLIDRFAAQANVKRGLTRNG